MQNNNIAIRDQREKEWFWMNNEFTDIYGELVGTHAVAVYSVLCRHSNNETQKCFPSMETIGKKAGIKSRKTVSHAIETLEEFNIIRVEKASGADGKRLNNIYHLQKPSLWKKIDGVVKENSEYVKCNHSDDDIPTLERKEVKKSNVSLLILPEWLDVDAWMRWDKFRKEIKKPLTPITVKLQLAFLEEHKKDHVAIIDKSIMNTWQGLFPLVSKQFPGMGSVKKVEAPSGKYKGI